MPLLTEGVRDGRQMWQGESGRNTQFGTNCGRLPAAFLAAKQSAICCRTDPSFLCIGKSAGSVMQVWCGKRKPRCWHTGTSWNQYQKKGRHKKTDTLPDNKMPGQKYFMMQSGEKDLCLHQRHLKGFHHTKGFLVEYEPVFRAVGLAARILGLEL